jgi:O-antigen ligase
MRILKVLRIRGNSVKSLLVLSLLVLFAYQTGAGLIETVSNFTLGRLAGNMLPALSVGGLLAAALLIEDFSFLKAFWEKSEITIKQLIFIGVATVFLGIFLPFVSERGLTEAMVIIVVIAAFFLSLYFMISGRGFYAVATFLLVFPFISLIEYWLRYITMIFKWGPITLTPTISFLLILFFLSLILQQRKNPKLFMPTSLKLAILIFLSISLLSSIVSINPLKSLQALYLEFVCPLMLFFIILRNLQEEKQVKLLAYSIVVSGVLISFISLYFFGRHFGECYSVISEIKTAFLAGYLHTGSWMSMVTMILPIAIVLSVLSSSKRLKLIIWGSIGFLLASTIVSFKRAEILTVFALFATLTIAKRSRRAVLMILGIVGIIGFLFFSPLIEEFVRYNFPDVQSLTDLCHLRTLKYREGAWIAALDMIKDYPILGIGTGLWDEYIPKYGTTQSIVVSLRPLIMGAGYITGPHNYYIQVATYSGLSGFIAWISLLVIVFQSGIKLLLFTKDESRYYLTLGAIAGLISYLTRWFLGGGFVDGVFLGTGFYFFTLIAIIVKLRYFERQLWQQ